MKSVGVKTLKSRLSEYLRLVKAGEVILVTERDEVIAQIKTARIQELKKNNFEEIIETLAEEGRLTLRSSEILPKKLRVSEKTSISSQETLDYLRGDR